MSEEELHELRKILVLDSVNQRVIDGATVAPGGFVLRGSEDNFEDLLGYITAFRYAVADLRGRFAVRRVVVVANRGVVSEPLLEALDKEEVGYIVGIPLKKWRAADRVLRRAGRYHEVTENLRVKEVWDNGEPYVICHNREREPEDARRRTEIVAALEAELARSGLAGLAKQKGYRRYIKVRGGGHAEVNWGRVKRA